MKSTAFTVSRFENRNGVTSWRVSGWLHSDRVRRNFRTKEAAAAEKASLEIKAAQESAGLRPTATLLTEVQLREAELAFRRLEGCPWSLLACLEHSLANRRLPQHEKPLAEAIPAYVAMKAQEHERALLSERQLRSIMDELAVFNRYHPDALVSKFGGPDLTTYLERGKPSLKTYNNRRGLLSTFFKFALQHDWVTANPVEKTPHHRINHRRGSAATLDAQRSAELMGYLEGLEGGILVPHFALCLFAGIRPCTRFGEISKLRPESIRLDTGTIHIEPEVSKVRMKRLVTIQPNLSVWLRAYPLDRFEIVPPNASNARARVCAKFGLTHDVLRHTFISMFVAKFRSMGEAALQAGNSESIIRKHYLDLKSPAEAEEFFSIQPHEKADVGLRVVA
ncbi:MAG TPA: site-specific integrase [Opitutaceae bacterium]|jgi:integrase